MSGGRTQGRLDTLDIMTHDNASSITNLHTRLSETNAELEDIEGRLQSLEQEPTLEITHELQDLREGIMDIIQYLKRRDGVQHLGRYAQTHEELEV